MKLLLVDDHPLFLEGLQYLLKTYGIEVAGIARSGSDAITQAVLIKPDIILMDVKMPDCSGLDALRQIKAAMPEIKIVMLTTSDEDQDLFEAYRCGASGYLLKTIDARELVNTLRELEKGVPAIPPNMAARILNEFNPGTSKHNTASETSAETLPEQLTERQLEILGLVAVGATYKEAAQTLGLSERTIKYHMSRIIEVLHLKNRTQVIAYAARSKLADLD